MKAQKQSRLLVCDPDPQGQVMIQEYLQDCPIGVSFTSTAEPLETTFAKHSPFNAVVIDLSNPVARSCNELVASVKKVAPHAEIIFLSRLADELLWSQVLALGAYDLLPKPLERTEFLRTVFGAIHHERAA